jgi:O-antigen ligase
MTDTRADPTDEPDATRRWSLLGLGGALSLCCLVAAPAATGAVGGTVAGGTTAVLGGGVVQILVSAVTVAVVGIALRLWTGSGSQTETE